MGSLIDAIVAGVRNLGRTGKEYGSQITGLPKVLWNLGENAVDLLKSPRQFILTTIVEFAIGAVLGMFLEIGSIISDAFGIVTSSFSMAGVSLLTAISAIGTPIVGTINFVNRQIGLFLADTLGITGPFVVFGLYALEIALFIRALPPLLVALSDALGSVPVLGSILDAMATFAVEYIGGDDG